MTDARILHAPAAERNREPILEVLERVLPARGTVLEVASGTGQHVVHFAAALPALTWQPSEPDPRQRDSIAARVSERGLANVRQPLDLDVLAPWPAIRVDAVIDANLLHVSGPETVAALCGGAAGVLVRGSVLHVYGPFNRNGEFTSEGNARFDTARVRFPTPELAVMHARAGMAFPRQERPSPNRNSMQLFVVAKAGIEWQVEVVMNARRLTMAQQFLADDFHDLLPGAHRRVTELIAELKCDPSA